MDNVLQPLKEEVGEISESEKAYFVILFGGEIYKNKYSGKSLKAIVLCVNGISSSLIMQKKTREFIPDNGIYSECSSLSFRKITYKFI